MPLGDSIPGSARDWIRRARADLALARIELPEGGLFEDLCFHAQQAAEKAIKAVYVHHGWTFRFVHDLEELITGLKRNGIPLPDDIEDVLILTSYASDARYPGLPESVEEEEHHRSVVLAERVVNWASSIVEESRR